MTDPTGRSFLSYRRSRAAEAALLVQALNDHGIPTWQDIRDLGSVATEDEIRRVLGDPTIASALLFITPEVEDSAIIRKVEIPCVMRRVERRDAFFAVPVAACGLDYDAAAEVVANEVSAQDLRHWNMERIASETITSADAATIARRVLVQRMQALNAALGEGVPLRMSLFVRRPAPFERGTALALDWSDRFVGKEAGEDVWRGSLLPALRAVADSVRMHAPRRDIEASGIPTLPAAVALGCAFLSTGGIPLSWRQQRAGAPDQVWSLDAERTESGFSFEMFAKGSSARDLAVLVSVADNVEPVFASCQRALPALRAMVHVRTDANLPFLIRSAGQAVDIARVVEDALRTARREYGGVGTVHLFLAVPAGLAVLIGQLLNTFGAVQTYEHVPSDGSGSYRAAALLQPCA